MNCIKILNYQDQVIPKIDYAIWLHLRTCPKELKRILSKHDFRLEKAFIENWNREIPFGETLDWFKPITLGNTFTAYEYSTNNNRNIQTIWTNLDLSEIYLTEK